MLFKGCKHGKKGKSKPNLQNYQVCIISKSCASEIKTGKVIGCCTSCKKTKVCIECKQGEGPPSAVNCVHARASKHTLSHAELTHSAMCVVFQGHQQSSWTEAGGWDTHVVSEAHRQHRGHLLRFLHHIWNPGSSGESLPHTHTHTNHLSRQLPQTFVCQINVSFLHRV